MPHNFCIPRFGGGVFYYYSTKSVLMKEKNKKTDIEKTQYRFSI